MQGQDYISTSSFDDNTIIRKMDVRTLASSWALVLASPDQRAWLSNLQQIALIFFDLALPCFHYFHNGKHPYIDVLHKNRGQSNKDKKKTMD